jgi:hypothetical protein
MATNPYAHKNGSQRGISPNKVFLLNVSTPVLINKYSEAIIIKNPNARMRKSFLSLFIIRAMKIIPIHTAVRI